jgi:hypothetical protein
LNLIDLNKEVKLGSFRPPLYGKMPSVTEGIKTIIMLPGNLAAFCRFSLRPQSVLAAEDLFPRKRLAKFQERNARPRRPDTPPRIALVLLSRLSS